MEVTRDIWRESQTPARPEPTLPDPNRPYRSTSFWSPTTTASLSEGRDGDEVVSAMRNGVRHCESCGRFVSHHHLRTARYFYDTGSSTPDHITYLDREQVTA